MTLRLVPPLIVPTVITTGSKMSNVRVTVVCSATIIWAAATIGSRAWCGAEPWPPSPCTVTKSPCDADRMVPGRLENSPDGRWFENTCMPKAASTRLPAASSTPSRSITPAPSKPSSPGWNMNTTSPLSASRCLASSRAAPTSAVVCRSCPQACIAPFVAANSRPVCSSTGSASMSPRIRTARGSPSSRRPPRSTPTTDVVSAPVVISRPRPSSSASTRSWVCGSARPTSGRRCRAFRSSTRSPCIAAASSRNDTPIEAWQHAVWTASNRDGQARQPVDEVRREPPRLAVEAQLPQLQELAEERLHLQPGERRAEAEVRALPERDVVVGAAGDVEAERVGEAALVDVGRHVVDDHLVARPDRLPAQLQIAGGGAAERQHGRVQAQHLLDRRGQQRRVGPEPRVLVRVPQQQEHAAGQRAADGVVARDHEQEEEHLQLGVGQLLAVHLGLDQRRHDVVGGLVAFALGQLLRVAEHV